MNTSPPTESQLRYQAYLLSDYWKRVTEAVKARDGYRCRICNSPHDLQAHHRSYEHRGRELEFLDDLTCLCRRCHDIFHGGIKAQQQQAEPSVPKKPEMVFVTAANCHRLRCTKEPYHWMLDTGINPKKKGWAKRAIGYEVPTRWMRGY